MQYRYLEMGRGGGGGGEGGASAGKGCLGIPLSGQMRGGDNKQTTGSHSVWSLDSAITTLLCSIFAFPESACNTIFAHPLSQTAVLGTIYKSSVVDATRTYVLTLRRLG